MCEIFRSWTTDRSPQLAARLKCWSTTNPREAKASHGHDNSNVSKILPLTTLRTIDLAGKKISGPLFSGFCTETRVFFDVFLAPEYVQVARLRAPSNGNADPRPP